MEQLSGAGNWRLTIKRYPERVSILHAETSDEKAIIPDELFGLPVTELGTHAFGSVPHKGQGEEVMITCGPAAENSEWDNQRMRELTLPSHLKHIGDFAFLNCRSLCSMRLWDDIESWGAGALTNCSHLHRVILTRTSGKQGVSLARLTDELPHELDVTIMSGGQQTRLIFPAYEETYEEVYPAQGVHFAYRISGAGYQHHHCFNQKKLFLRNYDDLWKKYLGMRYNPDCAMRLAWWRLRYPTELSHESKVQYLSYLREHTFDAIKWLLSERDVSGLTFLLEHTEPSREMLTAACGIARKAGCIEFLALLLEEQHKRQPSALDRNFDI